MHEEIRNEIQRQLKVREDLLVILLEHLLKNNLDKYKFATELIDIAQLIPTIDLSKAEEIINKK